jgi:hypothetical protein
MLNRIMKPAGKVAQNNWGTKAENTLLHEYASAAWKPVQNILTNQFAKGILLGH